MPLQRFIAILALATTSITTASAQNSYPQDYFRNPLGIPIVLAGNFGECRPGHFHSGIDIKTLGKENQPVYAAEDGYISRIKMEPGGFGHGLYITHPNGYTTLYAHLNDFTPALQHYVREQQYKSENWEQDLTLMPSQFPVKKGQQIAWSGNTGGSTAPHLHFEIRDSKTEHPLNPQLFGFDISDTRPPLPKQLAVYDLNRSVYQQNPILKSLQKKGDAFRVAGDTLEVSFGIVGLGLQADDYMNGSDNTLAFYTAEWYANDELQGRIRIDDIGYDETRYLHAYADYKTKETRNFWVQCLFREPGNALKRIYENMAQQSPLAHDGVAMLNAGEPVNIRIVLTDAAGNESTVQFWLKNTGTVPNTAACTTEWKPDEANAFENHPNLRFTLDAPVLYDAVCFRLSEKTDAAAYSNRYKIASSEIPAHRYFDLRIRPNKPVPFCLRSKLAMVYSDGKDESGKAATAVDQGWYKASVRNFGEYRLIADTTPPVIKAVSVVSGNLSKAKSMVFRIADAVTSVKTVRGEIDGQWVLFEQHGNGWTYKFDSHCPAGRHNLRLLATDENGNTATSNFSFTR